MSRAPSGDETAVGSRPDGPGGGFVFAAVHNIQASVPAENLAAMWETLREHGAYRELG